MTKLYKHFDKEGNLLYVGVALNAVSRLRHHKVRSTWFDDIAVITIETYECKEEALLAEAAAIASDKPTFNIAGKYSHVSDGKNVSEDCVASMLDADGIRRIVRDACVKAKSVNEWCKANNMTNSYLYEMLRGAREPTAMLVNKFGYRRRIMYEPMKKLGSPTGTSTAKE